MTDQRDNYQIGQFVQVRRVAWDGAEDITTWVPATVSALGKYVIGVDIYDGTREMCSPENVRKPS